MRHLHCADDWLYVFVHNLFNDSLLELVLNHVDCLSVFSICCVTFWNFDDLHHYLWFTRVDDLFNDSFWDPGTSRSIGM